MKVYNLNLTELTFCVNIGGFMLKHYDDGKDNSQSHEIYDEDYYPEINSGYGKTYEEALTNYIMNVKSYLDKISEYYDYLNNSKYILTVKVDCMGKII